MAVKKSEELVVMDFSGVYRREQFGEKPLCWVDVRNLPGTSCYCDGEAMEALRERIARFPACGIHFLDSGNYHYMSRLWLEKIQEPFRLLVFDNHTDMQLPAFGGLLSCGGWIADALTALPDLAEVLLVGPDREAYSQVEGRFRERVRYYGREALKEQGVSGCLAFFGQLSWELPLYISVDKDILCREEARTAWSQGDLILEQLEELLTAAVCQTEKNGQRLLGADICGESESGEENAAVNQRANHRLVQLLDELWP